MKNSTPVGTYIISYFDKNDQCIKTEKVDDAGAIVCSTKAKKEMEDNSEICSWSLYRCVADSNANKWGVISGKG